MKIINWIKNRSGKFALSTAQAVGAAAVVGVAGIAAWQMLSSSGPNQDTVFSSQDPDVVYVAGGAGGSYRGAEYGEGGELQSHINVGLGSGERLKQRDFEQEKLRGQNQPSSQMDRDEQAISAYEMNGASEGLGVGVGAQEMGGGVSSGGPQGVQDQIAAITAMANQKKEEAAAEAAAAAAGASGNVVADATQIADLKKNGGRYEMATGITRNNNSYSTDAFGGSTGLAGKGGRIGSSAETDRLAMGKSGQMQQGPSASNFGGYHGKVGNDLGAMEKYAYDARGKKMAVNQLASDLYMSAASSGGSGYSVDKVAMNLGGGSSPDLEDAMSSLGNQMAQYQDTVSEYLTARENLIGDVKSFRTKLQGILWLPDGIRQIVYIGMSGELKNVLKGIDNFAETWQQFGETREPTEEEIKDGTYEPTFSQISKEYTTKLYGDAGQYGLMPLIIGPIVGTAVLAATYNEYEKKVKDEAAEDNK